MEVQTRVHSIKGFSLIELMIALVIIMVSMLSLLMAIVNSMNVNLENDLRNTAIRITNQTAEALLTLPLEPVIDPELTDGSHLRTAGSTTQDGKGFPLRTQTVRAVQKDYAIAWTVAPQTMNMKEITITVSYTHKNKSYSNTSVIYKHRVL